MIKRYYLAASIICSDFLNLEKDIKALKKAQIDYIHFDVMDGIFVPRYGLPPEISQTIKKNCDIPITAHMMVEDPESYIKVFKDSGVDNFIVHVEPLKHLHRTLSKIKSQGLKTGVALNPATSLSILDFVLGDLDFIMLMAINPGVLGHKLIPQMLKKIKLLKEKIKDFPNVKIEIDGGVTSESAPIMINNGASILVCGTSTIFKPPQKIETLTKNLRKVIDENLD